MATKSKLTLLLELKNKLFNNKMQQSKKKVTASTDKMRSKIKRLKSEHLKAFKAMAGESSVFGRAMSFIGNPYTLIAAGLVSMITLLGSAGVEAKKFNHEFLNVKQLNLDKSKSELEVYKEIVRDSAFTSGKSAVETAKGYYDLQSALGVYGGAAKTIFDQVARYSTATGAELGSSLNATSKAMKAFNLNATDTKMLLESNAKTVQVGITNFRELAQVQTEYAGAAAGAGQSVNSANKLFAAFTSIAKDANTAATMTKTAFMGLTQASTIKGLKEIGINMYDAQGNMRELDGVLREVDAKFKNMSPQAIDQLINKVGGPEGLRALFTKLKTGSDDFFKTLDAFDSSSFDLDDALKNAVGDVTVLGDMVKNRFSTIMSKLGEVILPIVYRVLEAINKVLEWAYNNWDNIKVVLNAVGTAALTYIGYLAILKISSIAATVASVGLSGGLGLVVGGLHAIKLAIFSIPLIGWILAGVAALSIMYQKWDKFRAAVDALGSMFGDVFSDLWEAAKGIVGSLVDQFMGLGKIIKGIFTLDKETISKGAEQFKKGIGDGLNIGKKLVIEHNPLAASAKFAGKYKEKLDGIRADKEAKEAQKRNLLDPTNLNGDGEGTGNGNGSGAGNAAAQGISTVTGAAKQPRSINIVIEAFNKGGINTSNTTLASKSAEEIEAWFNESMMRVVRNVELSNG